MNNPSRMLGPSERIALIAPEPAHLAAILSLWTDKHATQFIGGPRDPGLIMEHFSEYAEDPEGYSDREKEWWWSIVGVEAEEFIGLSSLIPKEVKGQDEVEIGYFLLPEFWGNGYATEASRLVLEFAFSGLELDSLIALIDPSNRASRRVAIKLRMDLDQTITREDGSQREIFRLDRAAWRRGGWGASGGGLNMDARRNGVGKGIS